VKFGLVIVTMLAMALLKLFSESRQAGTPEQGVFVDYPLLW
jgi:hypothetical protein